MLAIGDCLQNRYRVVRQLGHGGMGTVYEAHDERFENSVALKEVLIDLSKIADPVQQQMVARAFEREAKTLALLHHEAFPHVIDYFSERNHQYLIMELIRGEDLGEQLQARKKPFDFEEVLNWTQQLLDALDYLHTQEQPIIHRDLKPQNMKITDRGKVKVLDFGIAKGADNKSSSTITNQTFVAATLNYSPIEQLLRVLDPTFREFISQRHKEKVEDILEHTADARSDLYSLGATLYQLLTATQPHDTLKRALDIWAGKPDPLPNPMELNPSIPPYFNSILLKAMEIDRDSRYVSAVEMQAAIKNHLQAENQSQNQSAWLAEYQKAQNAPQAPDIGMQTQLRIAEEQKFLAELDSPTGAKTEVLSPLGQSPATPVAPPPTPFIPPVDPAEEQRRIAEQQKFLAELDGPSAPAFEKQAPVQDMALTDYGQSISPSHMQTDQTNYAQVAPSMDQTQVSHLANILPPAQAKAADATVINPRLKEEITPQQAVQPQQAEETSSNKLVWLIPVGAIGALLVVSVLGVLAYFAMRTTPSTTDTKPKTPVTVPSNPSTTEESPATNNSVAEQTNQSTTSENTNTQETPFDNASESKTSSTQKTTVQKTNNVEPAKKGNEDVKASTPVKNQNPVVKQNPDGASTAGKKGNNTGKKSPSFDELIKP